MKRAWILLVALGCVLVALLLFVSRAREAEHALEPAQVAVEALREQSPARIESESTAAVPARDAEFLSANASADAAGFRRLRGLVVDPDGKPVAGASVRGTIWKDKPWGDSLGSPMTASLDDGSFGLQLRRPGAVTISASHGEWASTGDVDVSTELIASGTPIRLQLKRLGTIEGLALDRLGHPFAGQRVWIDYFPGRSVRSATLDDAGAFVFDKVQPGRHVLTASLGPRAIGSLTRACSVLQDTLRDGILRASVEVRSGETAQLVLGGTLPGCVRVHGKLTDKGKPVSAAWIWIDPASNPASTSVSCATTDALGEYEFAVEHPRRVLVRVCPGEDRALLELAVTLPDRNEFTLDLELAQGRIAGRVVDPEGHPLAQQPVELIVHRVQPGGRALGAASLLVPSAEDGSFAFSALAAGTYELRAGGALWGSGYARASSGRFTLADGEARADVVLALGTSCWLKGEVHGVPIVHGVPDHRLAEVFVDAFDARGNFIERVACDGDNHFMLRTLGEGEWRVRASCANFVSPLSEPLHLTAEENAWIDLTVEQGTEVRVRVSEAAGARAGRFHESVVDEHGILLSEGMVDATEPAVAASADSEPVSLGAFARGLCTVTITAEDGRSVERRVRLSGEAQVELKLELPALEKK